METKLKMHATELDFLNEYLT